MKNLIEIGKKFDFVKNCRLLVPLMFLIVYPVRKQYAFDAIQKFVSEDISEKRKRQLARKMIWCKLMYHYSYGEYFLFDAENLSRKGKASYISNNDAEFLASKMNLAENKPIFVDKIQTYEHFGKYYCRTVCFINDTESNYNTFLSFVEKTPKFIAKPLNQYGGHGVAIYNTPDFTSTKVLFEKLIQEYGEQFLLEELITQTEELARFNPSSVNTLRIPTYNFGDRIEIRHPFLRIGRSGQVVDNVSSGGICALIDCETGIVWSASDQRSNNKYVLHPDNGEQLIGYVIPKWEEAKALAKELAQVVPTNRYTGWDLALTDTGWVMVEGNCSAGVGFQIPERKGCRDEMKRIIAEMKENEKYYQ